MPIEPTVKVFVPDEVVVSFGPVLIKGRPNGEFLRVEQDEDDTTDEAGTDGEVVITRSNDRRATATIILMQTSNSNDELSVLSQLAREAPNMAGAIHPFLVKDLNGTTIIEGTNAWIAKSPKTSLDKKPTNREWKIRIAHLQKFDGGNAPL